MTKNPMQNETTTTKVAYSKEQIQTAMGTLIRAMEPFPMPLTILAMQRIMESLEKMGVEVTQARVVTQ